MATDKSKRAGKAFVEAALREDWTPQLRKVLRKLQLLGQTVQAVSADAELAEIRRQYDDEMRRLIAEFEDMAAAWEKRHGEPYPRSIDKLKELAVRSGVSGDRIMAGKWNPVDVEPIIQGWLLRQKDVRPAPDATRQETGAAQAEPEHRIRTSKKPPKSKRKLVWDDEVTKCADAYKRMIDDGDWQELRPFCLEYAVKHKTKCKGPTLEKKLGQYRKSKWDRTNKYFRRKAKPKPTRT
jgi:hypothetical protein